MSKFFEHANMALQNKWNRTLKINAKMKTVATDQVDVTYRPAKIISESIRK